MNIQILLAELDKRIKFHHENQNDPHNVGNAASLVLHEMRDAIAAACEGEPPTKLDLEFSKLSEERTRAIKHAIVHGADCDCELGNPPKGKALKGK
jgi:hypothetical protein